MGLSTQDGDITHRNGIYTFADRVKLPNTCIGDASIDPVSPLGTSKTRHRSFPKHSQFNGSANVAAVDMVHEVYGAVGSLVAVRGSVQTACIAPSKTTVDIKKNGVSILTAPFDINAAAAVADVVGSIASAGLVAGDKLTVVVTLTGGGTQGQGLFVQLVVDEDPT